MKKNKELILFDSFPL